MDVYIYTEPHTHPSKTMFCSLFFSLIEMAPEAITKPMNVHRRAYVTFLAGNGDYVKGVVGLAKGLRKAESAYPLVVAILPDVPEDHRQILVSQGCIVREIEPVYPPENQTDYAMAYYVINYSKLRIWEVNLFHCHL
jgi:inositol 3-alpha-galactosyltransferase